MADEQQHQVGRLSLRHEGDNWNAYYAETTTMAGAAPLGSIRMALVVDNPVRRAQFVSLMRESVADIIEHATGHRPTWGGEQSAPEHERAGHG